MESGDCLATFSHDDVVREARFSPRGSTVGTCGHDRTVRLWAFPPARRSIGGLIATRWMTSISVRRFPHRQRFG